MMTQKTLVEKVKPFFPGFTQPLASAGKHPELTGLQYTAKLRRVAGMPTTKQKENWQEIVDELTKRGKEKDEKIEALSKRYVRPSRDDQYHVILCKDCKFGESETNAVGQDGVLCSNKHNPIGNECWIMPLDWFCADGEMKS